MDQKYTCIILTIYICFFYTSEISDLYIIVNIHYKISYSEYVLTNS